MRKQIAFLLLVLLTACSAAPSQDASLLGTPEMQSAYMPTATSSPISTPTVDAISTARMLIQFDQATGTAAAASTSTAYAVTSTQEAKSTEAFWVGVTLAVATQQATETQIAKTEIAGTSQASFATSQSPSQTALAATQVLEQDRLQAKRIGTWTYNVGTPLIVLILCGLLLYWLFSFIQNKKSMAKAEITQKTHVHADDKGRFPLVNGNDLAGGKLINPNLQYSPVLDPNAQEALTAEQSLANTANARQLEAIRVVAASSDLMKAASASAKRSDGNSPQNKPAQMPTSNIPITKPDQPILPLITNKIKPLALPDWSMMNNSWDGKQLPYGVGVNGLYSIDPMEEPHLLIVGRTRSGKSRYGLRTVAAAALTMGYQVLFLGKRVDFYPFENHPNAKIVGVDLYNEPTRYLETLRRVAMLMKKRDDYLTERRMSIWQQTGEPQLYVVLDEFSSAVKQLNAVKAGSGNLVSMMATALVQEGGKYGINIIQVVQDATGANVDISARRNMGRMVFRLSESISSDVALGMRINPDATQLPARHFFTTLGTTSEIALGAAFAPSDDEIREFLNDHSVTAHAPMTWLDGVIVEDEQGKKHVTSENSITTPDILRDAAGRPVSATLKAAYEQAAEEDELENRIAQVWLRVRDQDRKWTGWNGLEREIYGDVKNGARQVKIKKVIANIQGVSEGEINQEIGRLVESWIATTEPTTDGTTRSTTPNIGDLGLFPAS